MRHLKTLLAVVGAVTVLVLAGNTIALATTGQALLLGKSNSANNITALTRTTSGTALKITTKSSTNAPLSVNGKGKVGNLNADRLDGFDSSTLRNRSYVFTRTIGAPTTFIAHSLNVPTGTYAFSYSAYLAGVTGDSGYCQLKSTDGPDTTWVGISQVSAGANYPGVGAAGVIVKHTGGSLTFQCGSADAFFTSADTPIQIVLTPTTVVGGGDLS